jgi:hypothetical protein
MIRFAEGAAHPTHYATPPGIPRLGEDAYAFAPSFRRVPGEEVPAFLADLPSPAMLLSTTTQGVMTLLLLDELSGQRAAGARKEFANQQAALEDLSLRLGLTAGSRILLEFDGEERVVTLAVLRVWSERFMIDIGWNVGPLEGDPRASARLNLFRSDGIRTPDVPSPRRTPEPPAP